MKGAPLAIAGVALASAAQVVRLDIAKRSGSALRRRALDATTTNDIVDGGYFISVQVGTPGQNLTLQLDTGSSDVWVPYVDSSICQGKSPGCPFGSFNPNTSTTLDDVGPNLFNISYVDGSFSTGDYIQDVFQIGGAAVKNLTMGLGLDSTISWGLIGVGYVSNEAAIATTGSTYPNLPVALQQDGLIPTIAYSLWLNDLQASTGSILFGGIDTDKYVGTLTKLDIVPTDDTKTLTDFAVNLYSVQATSSSGSDVLTTTETSLVVVLDSGTTLTYLPQDMAEQAWEEVGATYDAQFGAATIPCSSVDSAGYFTFTFAGPGGPQINVTMDELVIGSQSTPAVGARSVESTCSFGIQNQTGGPYLLGDSFLRSAYVVYDLVNNQVGIAPTTFNSTTSNVVAFASEGAQIPSATSAPDQTAAPPQPTTTTLSASNGFQLGGSSSESAAGSFGISGHGMVVVGLTMAYALMGSALFGIRLL